jgi:hypothetical protein
MDMRKLVVVIGAVVLLLLLNLTVTYATTYKVELVDGYELSKEYFTIKKNYNILYVSVTLEMTVPKLLINGVNYTFTYKILLGDAPSDWILNITKVTFTDDGNCVSRSYVQRPAKVLRGGESMVGQFTVKAETDLAPGIIKDNCYPKIVITYFAKFGLNQDSNQIWISGSIPMVAKELPLEVTPNITANVIEPTEYRLGEIHLSGEIKIKNIQSWDIIIKRYRYNCDGESLEEVFTKSCNNSSPELSSIILRPGQEYAIKVDYRTYYKKLPLYVKYLVDYLYPGGEARTRIILKVSVSGKTTMVGRLETKSPISPGTATMATPATTRTETVGTTRVTTGTPGGAPVWPVTPAYTNTFFGVLMLMVPIALVTAVGIAIAAYSARKSRTMQSGPKAEETAQGPSKPSDQSTTQVGTQGIEPSLPTSQETTQSQTAPPGQAEQPKPPQPELRQPKLQTPPWLRERSKAIISKLASARTRIELGDLNDAILEIHKAVNATISLILEAEGLSMKGPDGKELSMSEKFRLIAERGWVSWNDRRYFIRLQNLRNRIEHYPERIHAPQTTASEVQELFRFHENFVRTSLRTLEELGRED